MSKILIFTGAGISAESGIATFRDKDGLWQDHDIDVVCNSYTWRDNYDKVHTFYNMLRTSLADKEPNAAHKKVAEWQGSYDTVLMTQNVDDLFERAGCQDIIHLHGHLTSMRCIACGGIFDVGYRAWNAGVDTCEARERCDCRKAIKPNVVFFNEEAPLYRKLYRQLESLQKDDTIVVIGTSSQVINISGLLIGRPGYKILNNLEPCAVPAVEAQIYDTCIYEPATVGVDRIDQILKQRHGSTSES